MSMQQIMRWGMIFLTIGGVGIFNLWGQWGKSKCLRENPSNPQLPIFIRGNLGSKMGLIRKCANNKFYELEFKNQ